MLVKKWIVDLCLGFVKVTGFLPAQLFLKPRVHLSGSARRKLPRPCILISNHVSLMDFVLYLLVFPLRTIRFLMAEVLFQKGKLFGTFLHVIGGIRVNRQEKEFGFIPQSIEILDRGGTLGIFPQGRLPVGGETVPFTVSTAVIALHADAPLVPVYTDGNYGLFKRANVVIGEPFYMPSVDQGDPKQLEEATEFLQKKVYELKAQLDQRITANGK